MSKYNVYLISPDSEELVRDKFDSVGLSVVSSREIADVQFDFYMTPEGQLSEPWWVQQYNEFIPGLKGSIFNKSYTAAMIATTAKHTYAITMGKSHFYVNEFSDIDFGVDIAQRIGDRTKYKMKNSDFFGGIKDKAITSNTDYYELDFQSGESVSFLKMRPVESEQWGKSAITFGNSVQFSNIDVTPNEFSDVLKSFDSILETEPLFPVPRSRRVTNEITIKQLDAELTDLIADGAEELVRVFDYDQFGVSFVFADDMHFSIKILGVTFDLEKTGSLTVKDIRDLCLENGFNIGGILNDVKIVMKPDEGRSITKSLKEVLDYKSEADYFLRNGKWYQFNQDFVNDLQNRLSEIEILQLNFEFKEEDFKLWQEQQEGAKYKEYYYNSEIARINSYELHDRNLDYRRLLKFEVCDMYDRPNKTLIVTKRGEPIDLGYAIDQATTVVKLINNGKFKTEKKPIRILPVKNVELLLIFKKRTGKIESLTEIKSLTFQNKINDLYALCREKGVNLYTRIGYEQ